MTQGKADPSNWCLIGDKFYFSWRAFAVEICTNSSRRTAGPRAFWPRPRLGE